MIRLKQVLKEKQMTQRELSLRIKKSTITVSSWANGKSTPSIEVLIEICRILKCEIGELIEIKDKKNVRNKK
jgi:transcriptional regulator with XRE-family HTH domain